LAGVLLAAGVDVELEVLVELALESPDDEDVGEPFDSFPASVPDFLA
jgi:hypothetical protein